LGLISETLFSPNLFIFDKAILSNLSNSCLSDDKFFLPRPKYVSDHSGEERVIIDILDNLQPTSLGVHDIADGSPSILELVQSPSMTICLPREQAVKVPCNVTPNAIRQTNIGNTDVPRIEVAIIESH
jgi:hypothetical protein